MSTTRRAPCPVCDRGPKDRALAITEDERGRVEYCHRCQYTRAENFERPRIEAERAKKRQQATQVKDGEPPLRRSGPVGPDRDSGRARDIVAKELGIGEKTHYEQPLEWSERAESIWRRTQPLRGTIGQTYLEHRVCVLPPKDSHLRFLPASGKYPPSLCAAVTDARTAKPISLHFTRLATDGHGKAGSEQDKLLLAGHRKKDGCVRLWPNECVTYGLALAEGIESALAAAHVYQPVWAAVDAGNLAAFPVLAGIESLVIFADHDEAGLKAARECARRWAEAGLEANITLPLQNGADVADVVTA